MAVIGLGPTGTCFVWKLIDELQADPSAAPVRLTAVDPAEEPGSGYAFQAAHRLNMRAGRLHVDPRSPNGFSDWLRVHRGAVDRDDLEYPPRRLFGRYLRQVLAGAVASAERAGVAVEHWRTTAVDLDRSGESFRISGADGATRMFDVVVLATGESRNGALAHWADRQNFVASLADTHQLGQIPPTADVGIVGSSLSAVDVCVQLLAQGHQGRISCYSRTRGFPKVQSATAEQQPALLDPGWLHGVTQAGRRRIRLSTVARAVAESLDARAREPYTPGMPDAREWFSRAGRRHRRRQDENQVFAAAVAAAVESPTTWYHALDSLSPHTPAIWHAIDECDQMLFLTRCRARWNEYRHSMPLVNARALLPAVLSGQLTVRTGLTSVTPEDSGTARRWRISTRSGPPGHAYDFLVDATGGHLAIACQRDALLRGAIVRGLLTIDPRGGVRVAFDTCQVLSADGSTRPNLYLVGPLTFGTHFYTNSFETNRDNAFRVARAVRLSLARARGRPANRAAGAEMTQMTGGSR
ncbi:Uncharacterized NAD(P)/FAD-binding protein YdhS [Micromonospora pattaloongensis]|uniref:Uncharacterized NAD(P)/FAD-binding protein YdhS n=1 Tax=Micromonospora pattaloongensis TaxID=405436 RepID=A0A1H3R3M1_9ACTN|nr:Uncharacterized NAD(P)/FAD-binding protein YdhS [Micromonospora pattaloongensis]